jgi:hypothetical protein
MLKILGMAIARFLVAGRVNVVTSFQYWTLYSKKYLSMPTTSSRLLQWQGRSQSLCRESQLQGCHRAIHVNDVTISHVTLRAWQSRACAMRRCRVGGDVKTNTKATRNRAIENTPKRTASFKGRIPKAHHKQLSRRHHVEPHRCGCWH